MARHQGELADDVADAWTGPDGFGTLVTGAGAGNDVFFSAYDPAAAFYRSLADSLDGAIQLKLEPPMDESLDSARGRRAENWRSGMALPSVAANLETALNGVWDGGVAPGTSGSRSSRASGAGTPSTVMMASPGTNPVDASAPVTTSRPSSHSSPTGGTKAASPAAALAEPSG